MSNRGPSGYKIEAAVSAWQQARARLLADDADLSSDENALTELLGPEAGDVDSILARLLKGAVHAKAMAEAADVRADEIKSRRDRYSKRYETLRATSFAIMVAVGRKTVELPELLASIRSGTKTVVITDETKLEPRFFRIIPETKTVDKVALKTALSDDGEIINGAELSNGSPSITIRTR